MNPKSVHASLYYADDRDIYDILVSAKQKLGSSKLIEICARRRLVLSPKESREDLIDILSMQQFSWAQLSELLDALERVERREKTASVVVELKISKEDLIQAVDKVAEERSNARGEVHAKQASGLDRLVVKVDYAEFDESKTRLRQRMDRSMDIDLRVEGDAVRIRHSSNPRAAEVVEAIIGQLAKAKAATPAKREITLLGIASADIRNQFFLNLFSLEGHKIVDVTSVRVNSKHDSENDDAASDDQEESKLTAEDVEAFGVVKKILLEGRQLLLSPEYRHVVDQGHSLHRAVWVVEALKNPEIRIELEAGFSRPAKGEGFQYAVRGVIRKNESSGEFKKTQDRADTVETLTYTALLEKSAEAALEKARASLTITGETG